MKRVAFAVLTCIAPVLASGQLADFKYLGESYFDRELYLGLSVRHIALSTPSAPRPENHKGTFWTGNFFLYRIDNPEVGKSRFVYRNKIIGEIFYLLKDTDLNNNQGANIYRDEGSSFTNFLMGAAGWGWNFVASDRVVVAGGFNLTDFALGNTYVVENEFGQNEEITYAPHGWYLGAGPTLFADVALTRWLILEAQADYTLTFWNPVPLTYGVEDPDHKKPHAALVSARLMTPLGLFIGSDHSILFDRTPNAYNMYKTEIHFGWSIML